MNEDFLQYVWRTRKFARHSLVTTEQEPIRILDFGTLNHEGGPDFSQCRVEVGDTLWVGNVEIHVSSSEWYRHGHSHDRAYDSVILHVVLEEDQPVYIDGRRVPTLELKGLIPPGLLARHRRLMHVEHWVPCQPFLLDIPDLTKQFWLERMLVERLETRAALFEDLLDKTQGNWEEVLYLSLARSFGFKSNSDQMERMAFGVPLRLLRVVGSGGIGAAAMLFGRAGMLNKVFADEYPAQLVKEFAHLERKFKLQPMDHHTWQWGGLRPANFPCIRIAQFAGCISENEHLVGSVLDCARSGEWREFLVRPIHPYWADRSDFDKSSRHRVKQLGGGSVRSILANSILPFLFIYGKYRGSQQISDMALDGFMKLPAELNRITKGWVKAGLTNDNGGHSQALIHLKRHYCDCRRCTSCSLGDHILSKEVTNG